MKKRALLLGTSLLGMAMFTAVAAEAQESAPTNAAAIAASEAAAAEPEQVGDNQRGFYLGATVGAALWDVDKGSDAFDPTFGPATDVSDGGDFTWGIFFGYQMAEWLAVEVGYTDLGGFDADNDAILTNERSVTADVDGVEVRVRAWKTISSVFESFPLDGLALTGGAGMFVYSAEGDQDCSNAGVAFACPAGSNGLNSTEDSGEAFTLALGTQYQVHKNVVLRGEWQRYFGVLDSDVDTFLFSVVVGFYDFFGQGKADGGDDFGGIAVE